MAVVVCMEDGGGPAISHVFAIAAGRRCDTGPMPAFSVGR